MEQTDLVVIGGGAAGYPAASRASHLGGKVMVIEKENLGVFASIGAASPCCSYCTRWGLSGQ